MALYNEERPGKFSELLGQTKNVKIFQQILKSENLPNAFLFTGVRGTGKTSSARLFERALNCEHPDADGSPCNECDSCKEILAGNSMDVIELDAASHGGVDDVHDVLKMIQYTPVHKKKILVLDEVHMLSNAAFNALLKTIEEPPKDVIFIFCTTEEHKVPATIISRCRRFVFEMISDEVIENKLVEVCEKKGRKYEKEALGIIARASKGGMRDALSILEQFMQEDVCVDTVKDVLGIADEDCIFNLLTAITTGSVEEAVKILRYMVSRGKNLEVFIKALIDGCLNAVYEMKSHERVSQTTVYLNGLSVFEDALKGDSSKALGYIDCLSKVYEVARKDADMSFAFEMALMQMADNTASAKEMEERIAELEKKVELLEKEGIHIPAAPVTTKIEGIRVPVEIAENSEPDEPDDRSSFDNDIPFNSNNSIPFDMEMSSFENETETEMKFEKGEPLNLLGSPEQNGFPKGESLDLSEEENVKKEDNPVEEEPVFDDFFSMGGAWQ